MHKNTRTTAVSDNHEMNKICLTPVGFVRSSIKKPMLNAGSDELTLEQRIHIAREHHRKLKTLECELVVNEALEGILEGIEGFSHILVLYWPHLLKPNRRKLRSVHPMGRKDLPRQGIFATCSPARPNPVLATAVRLLERKGNVLRVVGFEAIDGSPILDIKPYSPNYLRVESPIVPDWMTQIQKEMDMKE